jgi:magnesium transporter
VKTLTLFIPEIREILASDREEALKDLLSGLHPVEIARGFEELTLEEQLRIFRVLEDEVAIPLFEELDFELQSQLLASLSMEKAIHVLDEMSPDERADLFKRLSPERVKRLFSLMKKEEVEDVVRLLKYREDTAGGIMTTDFVALPVEMEVDEAIGYIRNQVKLENISYVYVVDDKGGLKGVVSLRRLITSRKGATLGEIMDPDPIKADVGMDQEEVAQMVATYDLLAIPVVEDGGLVGVVTVDDCIDILSEEATEDIQKMSGSGYVKDIWRKPAAKVARMRVPWIVICLFGEMISAFIVKLFSLTLERVIALAFFIPVIMAMGGNVGTQSSAMITRGFATGEVDFNKVGKILFKEIMIGFFMGLMSGVMVGILAPILHLGDYMLGMVVGASTFIALTVATFVGALSPITLRRVGVDPAMASGPFVTTVVDITGLLIYFALATIFLRYLR